MINSTTRLKTIIIEYKNILLNDGMVTHDELKKMMSVDEELCTLCNYSEGALDKIGRVILRQANKNKNRRKVILDKSHINEVLEERIKLYQQGMSDVEIAKQQDVCLTTIYAWRETRRLKPNPTISEKIMEPSRWSTGISKKP